ncbi:MAG: hypothetical protein ACI4SR_00285 [Faecalibacillus sp.]
MNDEIGMIIDQIQKLSDQLESDYMDLHHSLQGTIYDTYIELVKDEIELLKKTKENMMLYQKNRY